MALLLDTGVIYALADSDDDWHGPCLDLLRRSRAALLAPVTVLPEVAYLLRTRLGVQAETSFVSSIACGEIAIEPLEAGDLDRCVELLARHPDIGFVDASVIAMAERLRLASIATTDRRHFAPIRPRHRESFDLLP